MSMRIALLITLVSLVACGATPADDPVAGRKSFRQQCMLCHTAEPDDGGGALGPSLSGVVGRKAADAEGFGYSRALAASKLVWDEATLDRFLAAPTKVVPGTSMTNAVPDEADRANLISYLRGVKGGTTTASAAPREGAAATATSTGNGADWRNDQPGRVYRIDAAKLPPPFATKATRNSVKVVEKPKDAKLSVPPGFKVDVFASNLKNPRVLRVAPNGDVFLSEPGAGRIPVLRPSADGTKAASVEEFAKGLERPFGMQFHPAGPEPKWLYVAEVNRVVRYPYTNGDRKAKPGMQIVVRQLYPDRGGGHSTRDLAFSPDGRRLFVSVGSESNVAEEMKKKNSAEVKAWEAQHGLGATWDTEENRAAVLVFDPVGRGVKLFATGIRNCVGLTMQPATGDLWCTVNERDNLGNDLVPDYSTRVKEGGFYGWPWYYLGDHEDPRLKGERPDLAGKAIVPDVLYTAHSAALSLAFYPQSTGKSAFPPEYVGDGFATLHGSWNREVRAGHKVVRVRMKDDVPTGEYEDFLTGFVLADGQAWGRPVGVAVAHDGSLLVSEDGNDTIYRISRE